MKFLTELKYWRYAKPIEEIIANQELVTESEIIQEGDVFRYNNAEMEVRNALVGKDACVNIA